MRVCWPALFLCALCACQTRPPACANDVLIVGAGMAGLSAAYELRDKRVVVLEREPRLGGRVLSQNLGGVDFELGALNALATEILPTELGAAEPTPLAGDVAIFNGQRLLQGGDVVAAIAKYSPALASEFVSLRSGQLRLRQFTPSAQAIAVALARLILPGPVADYDENLVARLLFLRPFSFRERGNQYYLERLLQLSNAKLQTQFNVSKVITEGGCAIAFGTEGQQISATYAVVATPAPAARRILPTPAPAARRLLEASDYAGGLVAHLAFRADHSSSLAYAVAVSEDVDAIVLRPYASGASAFVGATFYVGQEKAQRFAASDAAEIQRRMLEQLKRWQLIDTAQVQVLDFDYIYWPYIGPIFSSAMLAARGAEAIEVGPRILLAGDYAAFGEQVALPYGLKAAYRSGTYAAQTLRAKMNLE